MRRVEVCETMLSDYQDKMKCMITGDETWIYAYDPETTDQSSERRAKGETKSNLTSVSTIVKNVGISALYREGITLKGMKLICINK